MAIIRQLALPMVLGFMDVLLPEGWIPPSSGRVEEDSLWAY